MKDTQILNEYYKTDKLSNDCKSHLEHLLQTEYPHRNSMVRSQGWRDGAVKALTTPSVLSCLQDLTQSIPLTKEVKETAVEVYYKHFDKFLFKRSIVQKIWQVMEEYASQFSTSLPVSEEENSYDWENAALCLMDALNNILSDLDNDGHDDRSFPHYSSSYLTLSSFLTKKPSVTP